jgi:class 3 adenylate cyclase
MEVPPPTSYVSSRGKQLAYQALGDGSLSKVFVLALEAVGHLDLMWTDPGFTRLFLELVRAGRLVMFQPHGTGLSDPVQSPPSLEERAVDVGAVLDDAGVDRAIVMGTFSSCQAAVLFAVRNPERVRGLVLAHPFYDLGSVDTSPYQGKVSEAIEVWGDGLSLEAVAPGLVSRANTRGWALLERVSTSPATARWYFELSRHVDMTELLPLVRCPTLVLGIRDSLCPVELARATAELIPGAVFRAFPLTRPEFGMDEFWKPATDAMLELAGVPAGTAHTDRRFATLLFTDIVGSTELVARLGDSAWSELLREHDAILRWAVGENGGRVVTHTGDGALSVFDQPAGAVRCAHALPARFDGLELRVRAGIHCGECEFSDDNVHGMAVHVAARVAALADAREVLVSRTVRDLVMGPELAFAPRGKRALKGVPGSWELFALTQAGAPPTPIGADHVHRIRPTDRAVLFTARHAPGLLRAASRIGRRTAAPEDEAAPPQ